jgi:hypothetical protein
MSDSGSPDGELARAHKIAKEQMAEQGRKIGKFVKALDRIGDKQVRTRV